jgi:hypothetical protein
MFIMINQREWSDTYKVGCNEVLWQQVCYSEMGRCKPEKSYNPKITTFKNFSRNPCVMSDAC